MPEYQRKPGHGDFVGFKNRNKQPGDKLPVFEGNLTKPDSDDKLPLTLWAHEYTAKDTGEVKIMYSGIVGHSAATAMPPAEQVAYLVSKARTVTAMNRPEAVLRGIRLAPNQVVLFPNKFKDEAPEKNRPDYHGGVNYGDDSAPDQIGCWYRLDRNGNVYIKGNTSHPQVNTDRATVHRDEAAELVGDGQVSRGMSDGRA